jgi:hypothetical protein
MNTIKELKEFINKRSKQIDNYIDASNGFLIYNLIIQDYYEDICIAKKKIEDIKLDNIKKGFAKLK